MKFIAEHWHAISMDAFLAFVGVVLIVSGVREYRERRGGTRVR